MKNFRYVLAIFKKIIENLASPSERKQMDSIISSYLPFNYSPHGTSPKNMYKHIEFERVSDQLIMKFSEHSEFNILYDFDDYLKTHVKRIFLTDVFHEYAEIVFYIELLKHGFCELRFITEVHHETGFSVKAIATCFKLFFDNLSKEMALTSANLRKSIDRTFEEEGITYTPERYNLLLEYR